MFSFIWNLKKERRKEEKTTMNLSSTFADPSLLIISPLFSHLLSQLPNKVLAFTPPSALDLRAPTLAKLSFSIIHQVECLPSFNEFLVP